jgi:hypothetical protein
VNGECLRSVKVPLLLTLDQKNGPTARTIRCAVVPATIIGGFDILVGLWDLENLGGTGWRVDVEAHRRQRQSVQDWRQRYLQLLPHARPMQVPNRGREDGSVRFLTSPPPRAWMMPMRQTPDQAKPRPMGMRIMTFNQGGLRLAPRRQLQDDHLVEGSIPGTGVTNPTVLEVKAFLDEGGTAVVLSEAGIRGDRVNELLRRELAPHRIFQHGATGGALSHSVMVIVNGNLRTGAVQRDPRASGRIMSVDILRPGGGGPEDFVRVIAAYMPSDLDNAPQFLRATSGYLSRRMRKRATANRIAGVALSWAAGCTTVLTGDLNETMRRQDRFPAPSTGTKGATVRMLISGGFVDMFPRPKDNSGKADLRPSGPLARRVA